MNRTWSPRITGRALVPILAVAVLGPLATACTYEATGLEPSSTGSDTALPDRSGGSPGEGPAFSFPAGERIEGRDAGAADSDDGAATQLDEALIRLVGDVVAATPSDVSADEEAEVRTGVVVGDSLTVSASAEIRSTLAAEGLEVIAVDAREGRRIARGPVEPGVDAVVRLRIAGADPDLWVFALGTNDVGAQADRETLRSDVGEILRLIPPDAVILWIDTRVDGRPERSVAANLLLRQVAVFDPRVEVVDWHTVAGEEGVLIADGVHLSPTGKDRFAATLAQAVGDHYDVPPLPPAPR